MPPIDRPRCTKTAWPKKWARVDEPLWPSLRRVVSLRCSLVNTSRLTATHIFTITGLPTGLNCNSIRGLESDHATSALSTAKSIRLLLLAIKIRTVRIKSDTMAALQYYLQNKTPCALQLTNSFQSQFWRLAHARMIGYINIRTFATLLPYPSDPEFSKSNIRSVRIKSDTLAALRKCAITLARSSLRNALFQRYEGCV